MISELYGVIRMKCVVDRRTHIDSFDDLLVGAPMYSDTQYEQGRVYVYMNNKKVIS